MDTTLRCGGKLCDSQEQSQRGKGEPCPLRSKHETFSSDKVELIAPIQIGQGNSFKTTLPNRIEGRKKGHELIKAEKTISYEVKGYKYKTIL